MDVKAKAKYIRISPRKVRLVVDVIRGMQVEKALDQLNFINKRATVPVRKLLNSAIANATNNFELEKSNLYIKEIKVDEGPTLKRWMPRAHGRATMIRKRTSHISVILGELVDSGKREAKKEKVKEPIKLTTKPKEEEGIKVSKKDKIKETEKPATHLEDKSELIKDPRREGRGKHTEIEGNVKKGFVNKIFRRKSG